MRVVVAAVVCSLAVVGCVAADIDDNATIQCGADDECPGGFVCAGALGLCVRGGDDGDRDAPGLSGVPSVEPAVVGRDAVRAQVRLVADEPLARAPRLDLLDLAEARSLRPLSGGAGDTTFLFEYLVRGDEQEGLLPLEVALVDPAGNETLRLPAGGIRFDFRAPRLLPGVVLAPRPAVARASTLVEVDVAFDEVVAPPTGALVDGFGNVVRNLVTTDRRDGDTAFTLSARLESGDPATVVFARVEAIDVAQNAAVFESSLSVTIDVQAPFVTAASVDDAMVRAGDLIGITVTLNEPVTATLAAGALAFEPVNAPSAVLRFTRVVLPGDDGSSTPVLSVVDAAGFAAELPLPGAAFVVDTVAPVVSVPVLEPPTAAAGDSVSARVSVVDAGTVEVRGALGGVVAACAAEESGFLCTAVVAAGASGAVPFIVEAVDAAGNVGASAASVLVP